MIITTAMLLNELKEYRSPAQKISRMVKNESLFPIVRGLYETDGNTPGYLLAASIYGPSYLSFDFALSFWGLIPEAVFSFTSATFDKKKRKQFVTPFGLFTYRDVPRKAYPFGIQILNEGDYSFFIANPEKALCDKLYILPPMTSRKDVFQQIFDDLRIDQESFNKLNKERLTRYAQLYQSTNHKLLIKWLRSTQ